VKVSDFRYELPPGRIAQEPAEPRDAARLLVHALGAGTTRHCFARDLPDVLSPGDLLVVNDTRVRAARLFGRRASGGAVELLLLERHADGGWSALARPAARLAAGEELELESGALRARVLRRGAAAGEVVVELFDIAGTPASDAVIEAHGRMPLPPYVRRARTDTRERDRTSYQTVYAREPGAVAAPTAGLHFTPELLARLAARGIARAALTLHVGLGTFRPVTAADTRDHVMHAERYVLPEATVAAVAACRARGGRVVAVGTTTTRVLEACHGPHGLAAGAGETALFITPGHRFRAIDALLTNFHLPESTLLMLVSAFAGRERTLALYSEALEHGYRFYSYGDALLLLS